MKEKEEMIDGGVFDRKAILAICEGVRIDLFVEVKK
jgi:hypothetical protein